MNFIFKDARLNSLDPSVRKEIHDKLFEDEKNLSILRFFVVCLNVLVYFGMDRSVGGNETLATAMIVGSLIYACLIVLFQPYKKFPLLLTSYFISGTDAILISVWIYATGGIESPFYLLWYASILAIAMRYSIKVTLVVACMYSLMYVLVIGVADGLRGNEWSLLLRMGYLVLIAIVAGLMSKGTIEQIIAKTTIQKSEEEIRKREVQLKEAHDKLEERVLERTKELNSINQQLKRTNEDLDGFVYSASHDLKSPISNIEALLNLLYEERDPMGGVEHSIREKLEYSLEKMKSTINNLAEVAKAQKEVYDDEGPIHFEEILNEVMEENSEILKIAMAKVHKNFSQAPFVHCSRICVKSIIYNLLTNAVKYRSAERPPVISFTSNKKDNFITLKVEDNGLGIDLDRNGKKLFAIFKRFHDHVEGAGIGLYTVKKLVEKYEGFIDVESKPGQGSVFMINFKIIRDNAASMLVSDSMETAG